VEARLPGRTGCRRRLAAPVLSVAAPRRRVRHRGLSLHPPLVRNTPRLQDLSPGGQAARAAGDHGAGGESHVRPASVVPTRAPGTERKPSTRVLRLERNARPVQGRAGHLQGLRVVELDLGPGGGSVLLASVLLAPAGPELRQPAGTPGRVDVVDYWLELGVDGLRLDAVPDLFPREGPDCEKLPGTHAFLA